MSNLDNKYSRLIKMYPDIFIPKIAPRSHINYVAILGTEFIFSSGWWFELQCVYCDHSNSKLLKDICEYCTVKKTDADHILESSPEHIQKIIVCNLDLFKES